MHPILFQLNHPHIVLRSYGAMLFVAFVAGVWHAANSARRRPQENISVDSTLDVSIWMIVSGIVFARLVFVALDPDRAQYHLSNILAIWNGGISFDGALGGALLAMAIFCAVKRIPFLAMADRCAAPAMIGYAIGRIGCFLNGCCYGRPTHLPWGVRFEDQIGSLTVWTPPSHPTQLYATALSLVWYAIMTRRERRGRAFVGELTCLYLMFSAIERFTIEFWRAGATSDMVSHTPFTTAQFFCFVLFGIGALGMIALRSRHQTDSTSGDRNAYAAPTPA